MEKQLDQISMQTRVQKIIESFSYKLEKT